MSQGKTGQKPKSSNPLVNGILLHLAPPTAYGNKDDDNVVCITDLPKRFTWYEPLILLNERFEHHSEAWTNYYSCLSEPERQQLFETIRQSFIDAGKRSSHVAINAPIQPHLEGVAHENILRAPTNLKPLFGDFGPTESSAADGPTQYDFDAAFWVKTAQLPRIHQVWAPRWTMFSRGNIREKARILGNRQHNPSPFPGLSETELDQKLNQVDVVDFFVGIGYFALPYLQRGVRKVFGWELNGWSIEGLRRGCLANGLKCKVYQVVAYDADSLSRLAETVAVDMIADPEIRCFAFHGDNVSAPTVLSRLRQVMKNDPAQPRIRHCNLGLLPSSSQAYFSAITVLNRESGWLHIHENVDINAIQQKQIQIEHHLQLLLSKHHRHAIINCQHIEMVKTYAPGIGHFVFDIKITFVS